MDLSGPVNTSGLLMRDGLRAAFLEANLAGGVRGHKLALHTLDDHYDGLTCRSNTQQLLQSLDVTALVGYYGSGTSQQALPLAEASGVPLVGAYSGADFLRSPFTPYAVNVRASYGDEVIALVDYLLRNTTFTKISIFYQNDRSPLGCFVLYFVFVARLGCQ